MAGAGKGQGLRPTERRARDAFARYERTRTAIMVGAAVKTARLRAGVSQVELARRCRTGQPAIARLERGVVAPTVASLDRIARALGAELVVDFEPVEPRSAAPAGSVRASHDS